MCFHDMFKKLEEGKYEGVAQFKVFSTNREDIYVVERLLVGYSQRISI